MGLENYLEAARDGADGVVRGYGCCRSEAVAGIETLTLAPVAEVLALGIYSQVLYAGYERGEGVAHGEVGKVEIAGICEEAGALGGGIRVAIHPHREIALACFGVKRVHPILMDISSGLYIVRIHIVGIAGIIDLTAELIVECCREVNTAHLETGTEATIEPWQRGLLYVVCSGVMVGGGEVTLVAG